MKKQEAVNTFTDGLIMDLNPLSMPNTALTNCLNGTLLTYNGNENMLQNDMGNSRIETAMLPTGYIPLGSTSFGGIIYIVSYNPIEKKCQIGSFPSPERNISKEDLGKTGGVDIDLNYFCSDTYKEDQKAGTWFQNNEGEWEELPKDHQKDPNTTYYTKTSSEWHNDNQFGSENNIITKYQQKINLLDSKIYAGDKYKIYSSNINDVQSYISAWKEGNYDSTAYPKQLKFEIISTLDNGKTLELTNDSVWTTPEDSTSNPPYYIYNGSPTINDEIPNLDEYRNLVGSNYDTYTEKVSGKLGIVAKLEVPTMFTVGYNILSESYTDNGKEKKGYRFYFLINWANDLINKEFKNRINPKGIICSIKDKNNKINIIDCNEEGVFKKELDLKKIEDDYMAPVIPDNFYDYTAERLSEYLQNEQNDFSETEKRQNNGDDFQLVVKGPLVEASTIEQKIITISVTPYMSFGQLQFLEQKLVIDTSKLYTGYMQLHNYQYYVEDKQIKMSFNVEAYPELGKSITDCTVDLFDIPQNSAIVNEIAKQQTYNSEYYPLDLPNSPNSPDLSYQFDTLQRPHNYHSTINLPNGYQEITIPRDNLINRNIYLVQFKFTYKNHTSGNSDTNRYFYRLMFNTPIFNNAYNTNQDFKDLYLYDEEKDYGITLKMKFNQEITNQMSKDNINSDNFPSISSTKDSLSLVERYNGYHKIDGKINIDSQINNLLINPTLNLSSDESSKPSILIQYNTELKYEQGDDSKITINGNNITINNNFSVELPYTVDYKQLQQLNKYKFVTLKCNNLRNITGNDRTDVLSSPGIMAIWVYAEHTGAGALKLRVNADNSQTYIIPNEQYALSFDISSMMSVLKKQFKEYDFLNIYFGIQYLGDNNSGYGFTVIPTSYYQGFLVKKPFLRLHLINCIRYNDSIIAIHRGDTQSLLLKYKNQDQPKDIRIINGSPDETIADPPSGITYDAVLIPKDKNQSPIESSSVEVDNTSIIFNLSDVFKTEEDLYKFLTEGFQVEVTTTVSDDLENNKSVTELYTTEENLEVSSWHSLTNVKKDTTDDLTDVYIKVTNNVADNINLSLNKYLFQYNYITHVAYFAEIPLSWDIPDTSGGNSEFTSPFYRYKKTGETTTVYSISNVIAPENTVISTNYTIKNLIRSLDSITLANQTVNLTNDEVTTNFRFKSIENLDVVFNLENIADNRQFISDLMSPEEYVGLCNSKLLTSNDVKTVWDSGKANAKIVKYLIINKDGDLVFNPDESSKLQEIEWYFAWESLNHDTGISNPKEGTYIPKQGLLNYKGKSQHQSCILRYTYGYENI